MLQRTSSNEPAVIDVGCLHLNLAAGGQISLAARTCYIQHRFRSRLGN